MVVLPDDVLELLQRQHGLVTRRQLHKDLAHRKDVVDGWVKHRHLVRVYRGVYRAPGAPQTSRQRALAAVLRCGTGARAGGGISCALHGLEGFDVDASPDVVVPPDRWVTKVPFVVRSLEVQPCDGGTVDRIPVLSAAVALIDVAPFLSERQLRVAIDSARRRRKLSLRWLASRCRNHPRHAGARMILGLIAAAVLDPESEGERQMGRLFDGFDWPLEWGVTDLVPNRRLDAADRSALMGFEYDGRDHHVLPTDRDADGLRDLECHSHGIVIIRITAGMLRDAFEETRAAIVAVRERRLRDLRAAAGRDGAG